MFFFYYFTTASGLILQCTNSFIEVEFILAHESVVFFSLSMCSYYYGCLFCYMHKSVKENGIVTKFSSCFGQFLDRILSSPFSYDLLQSLSCDSFIIIIVPLGTLRYFTWEHNRCICSSVRHSSNCVNKILHSLCIYNMKVLFTFLVKMH